MGASAFLSTQFVDQAPGLLAWQNWEKIGTWNSSCMPISEWEGTLYIAVIDPNEDIKCTLPIIRVLAHLNDLELIWNKYHPATKKSSSENVSLAKENTTKNINEIPSLPSSKPAAIELKAPSIVDMPEGMTWQPEQTASDAKFPIQPEGLSIPALSLASPPSGFAFESPAGFAPEKSHGFVLETKKNNFDLNLMPDGFSDDSAKTRIMISKPTEKVSEDSFSALEIVDGFGGDSIGDNQNLNQESQEFRSITAGKKNDEPDTNTIPIAIAASAEVDTIEENNLQKNLESTIVGQLDITNSDFVPYESCTDFDQLAVAGLIQTGKTFEHSMILLFQGGELKPWRWSNHWLPTQASQPAAVDLSQPSIFNIVFKTCLPYHGYVVSNSVNGKFFLNWNRGQTPAHITMVPLMVNERIAGMILGAVNSAAPRADRMRNILKVTERVGEELSMHFQRLRAKSAA
jgi:hypothetical protein